ncbi:hypothetical protein MVEN_01066000 [Mycena venus]|uniref:Cytochrome P450 n=1 Tax=Mycena venus TaxID=2733690 RepID=A0A8H6Y432_9AGAR|nr:hypothetical protein MVEN_01066000 [Mycena venus]
MFLKLLLSVAGSLGAYVLYQIFRLICKEFNSPLKNMPGPKSSHIFYGNLREIWKAENSVLHEQWVREYGSTLKYKGFFGGFLSPRKTSTDNKRKIMNPAFGAPQVRELTPIFVQKSVELRDIWASQVAKSGTARVDALTWLSKATLDIIGLAGFNYSFNSLASEEQTELGAAFATTFQAGQTMNALRMSTDLGPQLPYHRVYLPVPTVSRVLIRKFHQRTKLDRVMENSQAVMRRIGLQLLQESKDEMAQNGTFEKGRSRDLLSLLVRANTSKDLPASQRLSDEDVLAQVPTFLVAGHETTSTGTTWALFALTQNMAAQTRLRNELLTVSTDEPTMDELNALPYLDCVVRETLRIHAPVPATMRVAVQDDIVPLAQPFTDIHGTVHETLKVTKGQTIMIPILALNRNPAIWGPDSMEFVPERWESEISNALPGVWGHMLSFLGGPRACIGYRFSLIEMKALLFTLVRAFTFELAVPAADIGKKTSVVQRPIIRSQPEAGNQMPLIIKPYIRS